MSQIGMDGIGVRHRAEIPAVSRVGPLVASSVIAAFDPGTRTTPDDVHAQVANLFAHIDDLLGAADVGREALVKVDFWVPSAEARSAVNQHWVTWFPRRNVSPARHIHVDASLRVASCGFLAYDESDPGTRSAS